MEFRIGVKTRLDAKDGRPLIGTGRARLLELIDETGSISAAAKGMGMSYRYAWGVLRDIAEAAGAPLVASRRGGTRGGRTELTPLGRELLSTFRRVETAMEDEASHGGWPHPRIAVDAVVEDGGRVLLVRRGRPPFEGAWALPGGFVREGERLEEAVVRELVEETGVQGRILGVVGAYSRPDRDPRGHTISVVYALEATGGSVRGGDDAAEAAWRDLDDLPTLAFDHSEIVEDYLSRGYLRTSKEENSPV